VRQSGVPTAERSRRARAWVDFGVDESWERAAPRRARAHAAPADDAQQPATLRAESPTAASMGAPRGASPSGVPVRAPELERDAPDAWSHASGVSTPAPRPGAGVPGRRTVTIRGRGAERDLAFSAHRTTRRPPTRAHERPGFKPDRAALWAILLGVFLVLVAATSSHAATFGHSARVHHAALGRPAAAIVRVSAAPSR